MSGHVPARSLKPPLCPSLHGRVIRVRVLTRAVEELGLEWTAPEEPAHGLLNEDIVSHPLLSGQLRLCLQSTKSSSSHGRSPSQHVLTHSLLLLTPRTEEKGYTKLPPLEEAVAAHLCPPSSLGLKAAAHPSTPCRLTSSFANRAYAAADQAGLALYMMSVLQVFQAKLLRDMDESGWDPNAFTELRTATDLALRATKATAQAISKAMANLVVLECHLWLNLMEIRDAEKMAFLDSPVLPKGLFSPTMDGFTERFTEAQKTAQALRHFLPKRPSLAAVSRRPKTTSTQQSAKPAQPQPPSKPEPGLQQLPQAARKYPFLKHPCPRVVLEPEPQKPS